MFALVVCVGFSLKFQRTDQTMCFTFNVYQLKEHGIFLCCHELQCSSLKCLFLTKDKTLIKSIRVRVRVRVYQKNMSFLLLESPDVLFSHMYFACQGEHFLSVSLCNLSTASPLGLNESHFLHFESN